MCTKQRLGHGLRKLTEMNQSKLNIRNKKEYNSEAQKIMKKQ
jgi:hypothetical protein